MADIQLPSDEEIVSACVEHSLIDKDLLPHGMPNCFLYPPNKPPFAFIKYRYQGHGTIEEARNQEFAFNALQEIPEEKRKGIHIPKIYRVIEAMGTVHIVMEYVPGKTLDEYIQSEGRASKHLDELYSQIEKAVKLFLSFQAPNTITPGPVGGGLIRHPIFKGTEAPVEYKSVHELQDHISKVRYYSRLYYVS